MLAPPELLATGPPVASAAASSRVVVVLPLVPLTQANARPAAISPSMADWRRLVGVDLVGSALILEAFAQLASATVEVETLRWMRTLGEALIMEAVEGRWFRGLRKALQSFLEESAHRVSGDVRFTLRNGGFELAGLKAVAPLYIRDREQWEYAKAAAARSVTTTRFDGSPILAEPARGPSVGRRFA